MRVYVAGVQHECSSFSPIPASARSFQQVRWGADPIVMTKGLGYGESCEVVLELGHELIAGPFSHAQPSLPIAHDVWCDLRDEILGELVRAGDVDMVWLCLHGAQMSDREEDCEGDLLGAVRELVGDRVAVGCLLDLHTNLSSRMLAMADLVVACREYPHVDYAARARAALPGLATIRRGEVEPTTAAVRFLGPGIYSTVDEPMRSFVRQLDEVEARDDVVVVSVHHGFTGADQPDLSASVSVTTDGDQALATALARRIADDFREIVETGQWVGLSVRDAVDAALRADRLPVVLADRPDNPGAGAAGDATFVLAELLRRDVRDAALALVWDPVAVELCHDAGVGARIPLRIGGKCGPMSGDPVDVEVVVTSLRDDSSQALFGIGEPNYPIGRSAAVRVASADGRGLDIVLATVRTQVFSRHVFSDHGIEPTDRRLLVVKSTQHFVNDFGAFAGTILRCDPPGTLTPDLSVLPYRRARRPMLRLDPVRHVEPEAMPDVPVRRRPRS